MKTFLSLALAAAMSVFMAGCCGKAECKKAPAVQPKQECCKKAQAAQPKQECCKKAQAQAGCCCCKGKPCCACKKPAAKPAKKASGKKAVKKAPAKKTSAKAKPDGKKK